MQERGYACPPWRRGQGRGYTPIATALLALLALAGNHFHLSLLFGVDILFGSIAVLLALVWLGAWPGLLVALVGGAYTWLLWDHPYALSILVAEASAVAWHRGRARRHAREVPPLAVSVTLYWLLLGIPLVVLCYRVGLGMAWPQTLLVALKQALNGILNAGLAGLALLTAATLSRQRAVLPIAQVLFSVLLAGLLAPAILLTVWQSRDLKERLETQQAERLRLVAQLAVHHLGPRYHPEGQEGAALAAELKDLKQLLTEYLPVGSDPQVWLAPAAATPARAPAPPPRATALGAPPPRQTGIPTGIPGLQLILPEGRRPARMILWHQARYRLEVPAELATPDNRLVLEFNAAPLIDQVQRSVTLLLLTLLALTCLGVALAQGFSRRLVRPLQRLVAVTRALPGAIREDRPWSAPAPGLLAEPGQLADAVTEMAQSLAAGFRALEREQAEQVRQRALVEFQAQGLVRLVTGRDDEAAFAAWLCRQLELRLPGQRCILVQPDPQGAPLVLAAPGLDAAAVAELNRLLARPQGLCCYTEVLATGAPAEIPDTRTDERCADLPAAARDTLRAGWALPVRGRDERVLGVLSLGSTTPGHPTPAARDLLDAAATLAGLALDSIRLRQRHEVLVEALSQAGNGIMIARRSADDFIVSYVNRGFETLTGYSAAEVLDRNCRFLQGEDRDQPGLRQLRAALAAGLPCQALLRNYRKDGSRFWNSLSLSPLRATAGQVTHYMAVQQDVTEATEATQRLRRSEALLRDAQAIAHLGSWELDLTSGESIWSDETFRLLGYAPGAVTPGLPALYAVVPAEEHARIQAALQAAHQSPGLTHAVEHRVQGPDGVPRILLSEGRVFHDSAGRPQRLTGTHLDITRQHRAEQALHAQRQRLSNIIAATRVGTWEWEVQTGATVVNERWAAIVGCRLADLVPITIQTWIDLTHPDDLQRSLALAEAHFRGELEGYECELRMRHRDGHWVWVLDQGRVMEWDAPGVPRLMSGIHQDITERKHAELAVAQQESMVSELLALATRFVGVSDHAIADLTAQALARIGRFSGADRSYVFRIDEAAGTLANTLEWTAPGVIPLRAQSRAIRLKTLPELLLRLRRGEPIVIPRVAELTADWSREQALFAAQGIQSLLVAPLAVGDLLLGGVGFDAVQAPRDWSAMEARFLQVFASILAGALDRARTTEELRVGNARYEQLAHQSRSMSWEIDPQGRYTYVSPVCEQVLGYRAEALIGRYFHDLFPAADRAQVTAASVAIMDRRAPLRDLDRLCLGVDGGRVWLTTSGAPLFAPDGTYLGYRGIDTDITDRHLAQELIRESEARLNAVFENAPIGMTLIAADRRFTLVNRALATFLGRPPEELTGLRIDDVTHPDDLGANLDLFAELQAGQRTNYRITKHYLRPDGAMVWGDVRVTLLPSHPGAPPTPLAMIEDITDLHAAMERQRALEAALNRYAAQLEQLVDLINRPLPPTDKDRALLELGRQSLGVAAAILGLATEEREHRVLIAVADRDREGPGPALLQAVLTQTLAHRGTPCVLRAEHLPEAAASAGFRSCIALAFDCPQPDGQTETLVLSLWGLEPSLTPGEPERQMLRLIAQRIAAVRYQEQIHRDLIASRERETIGHLASGVAHDFNNLLGVIDANIYFLRICLPGTDTDPEIRQVLDETQSALGQAKVITSGMLSLSRAGGVPLEPVDLAPTVAELIGILRQILPPGIRLTVDIPSGLRVHSNAGFLQAALLNLALNARDAMPQGGDLRIEARSARWTGDRPLAIGTLPPMDCVELRLSDTGSGIAPGILARIFDPLFSTKAKQRGHGLGLFMVKEFITRSRAGLAVESQPGGGTRFHLVLPSAPPPQSDRASGSAADDLPPGLRVLLVDDDPRVRDAVARLLTLNGMSLEQAQHGQAALALLARDPTFDLVLSDIAMPILDGIGLYRHLLRERPGLPVILMTGQDSTLTAIDDLPERPLVLRKPLDPAALRAAIRSRVGPAPRV